MIRATKRARWTGLPAALAAAATISCGGGQGEAGARSIGSESRDYPRFDSEAAYGLVRKQVQFGPRVAGTSGHRAMVAWLEEYLTARADTVVFQRFTHVTVDADTISLVNVLARFGSSATRPLLLLTHWDTRPFSDQAADPDDRSTPVPGANDGASGTAILLQLAEMMHQVAPPRAVDLLLVDGEDYGDFGIGRDVFIGSRYFASNLPDDFDPEYGVLLDMVGDRDLDIYVEGNSNQLAPEVVDLVWNIAHRLGFRDVFHREVRHTINDDHIPLNDAGVPTIDVIDFDYRYWHTPEDTPDKVSASSLSVVGESMAWLIYRAE